jgi:HEAT repeat protein
MRALGEIGPASSAAVDRVLTSLEEDDESLVREFAAQALPKIALGNEQVPAVLAAALKDEEADVRIAAAKAVASFAKQAEPEIPLLIAGLSDPEPEVISALAVTLAKIGEPSLEPLLEAARSESRPIRQNSMIALGLLGYQSESTIERVLPQLIEGLKDADWQTRRSAARGLSTMGSKAKEALPALNAAMLDPNKFVRRAVAAAILEVNKP